MLITRRISSHDFFVGLVVSADVMVESSAREAGVTADAIICVSYLPTENTQLPYNNKYNMYSKLQAATFAIKWKVQSIVWSILNVLNFLTKTGLPKTWRDRWDSENGQSVCPFCVWQTGQSVPSVCDRRDRQTTAETWRDAEEKNQKCIRPINKIRKLQKYVVNK